MKGNWSIVPNFDRLEESLLLSKEYDTAFEYDDFCDYPIYSDDEAIKRRIDAYLSLDRNRGKDTVHGVFKDICFAATDPVIREYSRKLGQKSMMIAKELGCKGVVFHTLFIPNLLKTAAYREMVTDSFSGYVSSLAAEFTDLEIYVENTFETTPDVILGIMDRTSSFSNIKVCLDYAHAAISGTAPEEWIEKLAPYIGHMHLNDNDLKADLHQPVGDGSVDYRKFKELVLEKKTDTTMLIEMASIENARKSLKYLSNL